MSYDQVVHNDDHVSDYKEATTDPKNPFIKGFESKRFPGHPPHTKNNDHRYKIQQFQDDKTNVLNETGVSHELNQCQDSQSQQHKNT
jgi:hypothetical protein